MRSMSNMQIYTVRGNTISNNTVNNDKTVTISSQPTQETHTHARTHARTHTPHARTHAHTHTHTRTLLGFWGSKALTQLHHLSFCHIPMMAPVYFSLLRVSSPCFGACTMALTSVHRHSYKPTHVSKAMGGGAVGTDEHWTCTHAYFPHAARHRLCGHDSSNKRRAGDCVCTWSHYCILTSCCRTGQYSDQG